MGDPAGLQFDPSGNALDGWRNEGGAAPLKLPLVGSSGDQRATVLPAGNARYDSSATGSTAVPGSTLHVACQATAKLPKGSQAQACKILQKENWRA
ncbi:hypothetical protein D3C85_1638210 [compost metagenome]